MSPSAASWTVVFTPSAEADLFAIYDYIAERAGTAVASDFVGRIEQYCLGFSFVPERGTRRDDLRPRLRMVGFRRRATILFELNSEKRQVVILGIYYAGRNFEYDVSDE
jgi:toxin ParE1/3/4